MSTLSQTFPRSHRLSTKTQFQAVYDNRVRSNQGPLTVSILRNDLNHPRLGLSIPKRLGSAPKRNRVKRLLRESFRLTQHDLGSFDFLISVRPHDVLELTDYQRLFADALHHLRGKMKPR